MTTDLKSPEDPEPARRSTAHHRHGAVHKPSGTDHVVDPNGPDLISEMGKAGDLARVLKRSGHDGDYANPSDMSPTAEGLTLFCGGVARPDGDAPHSRRNGWQPDDTIGLVRVWIGRGHKSAR